MEDRIANVEQALARLEVKAEHLEDGLDKVLAGQERNHRCLQLALHGDLVSPGMVVRTDRLEGWRKRQSKFITLLFTVTLPLALARVWDMVYAGPVQ